MASDQYTIPDEDRTEALQVIPRAPEWSGDRAWINEYYRHVPQEDLLARTEDQLREQLLQLKKEQFNLRFQRATGQLENTARVREVRRDIARIKTILAAQAAPAA